MWAKQLGNICAYLITSLFVLVALTLVISGVFLVVFLTDQSAAVAQAGGNEQCLSCHGQPDFKTTQGDQEISLYVDAAVISNSVHEQLPCTSCHSGVETFPHARPVYGIEQQNEITANCSKCHADAGKDYQASIHGQIASQVEGTARCQDCHGGHDVLPVDNPQSLHNRANAVQTCSQCHQGDVMEAYRWSFHGSANKLGYEKAATCVDCHTAHTILPASDPASSINPANLPQQCVKCHGGEPVANWAVGTEHTTVEDREKASPLWITWKIFLVLIMVDIIKDFPIIILDLVKQIRNHNRKKRH